MRAPTQRLAKLRSYDEALKYIQKTKKTKGSNYVPLGERRYHAEHNLRYVPASVVGADADKIVVSMFNHPLIVFEAGTDRVTVNPDSGPMYTPQLDTVWAVLGLQCCAATNGKFTVYVNTIEENKNLYHQKFVLPSKAKFYVAPLLGGWSLLEKPMLFTYHINRREANIVRESTRKFKEYVELMLKLRDTIHVDSADCYPNDTRPLPAYMFHKEEFEHTFGIHPIFLDSYSVTHSWMILLRKPTNAKSLKILASKALSYEMHAFSALEETMTEWEFYRSRSREFMRMITCGNHEDYHKAMLILAYCTTSNNALIKLTINKFYVSLIGMFETFDEIILKANSNKCFRIVGVEQGVAPTDKYENYVFWGD